MGGQSQTTVEKADPWEPTQPYLKDALQQGEQLFQQGGFSADPYSGQRVAGFGDFSQMGQDATAAQAMQGAPTVDQAAGTLSGMMDPQGQSQRLDAVKQNALGSAIPAAVSQFAGSGMGNSTLAMDTVGRAATDAVAPYDYGAYQNEQGRALQAAGMAPQIQSAQYLPGQMLSTVGAQQDAMRQAEIDAAMNQYYEGQTQEADALDRYSKMLLGYGGQGGESKSTSTSNPGAMGTIGSGLQAASLMALMFSDRRLKRDIQKIGTTPGGHNLYSYSYNWSDTVNIGVMSDEVPHAVAGQVNGYDIVDYARVS